jgi:hypothetical protein
MTLSPTALSVTLPIGVKIPALSMLNKFGWEKLAHEMNRYGEQQICLVLKTLQNPGGFEFRFKTKDLFVTMSPFAQAKFSARLDSGRILKGHINANSGKGDIELR